MLENGKVIYDGLLKEIEKNGTDERFNLVAGNYHTHSRFLAADEIEHAKESLASGEHFTEEHEERVNGIDVFLHPDGSQYPSGMETYDVDDFEAGNFDKMYPGWIPFAINTGDDHQYGETFLVDTTNPNYPVMFVLNTCIVLAANDLQTFLVRNGFAWAENFEMEQMHNANLEEIKAGGDLDPFMGVSLEDWAGAMAQIVGGKTEDDVMAVLELDAATWQTVKTEWEARMARDTTATIARVYGEAFTNPNMGRFAG